AYRRAGTRRDGDSSRILLLGAALFDGAFISLHLLAGLAGIDRGQARRELEGLSLGQRESLEMNAEFATARDPAAAFRVRDDTLYVTRGGGHDLAFGDDGRGSAEVDVVAFPRRARVDRIHHAQEDVRSLRDLRR